MSASTGLQLIKREPDFEALGSSKTSLPFNNNTSGYKSLPRPKVESSVKEAVSGSEDVKSCRTRAEMTKEKKANSNEDQQMLAPDSTTNQLEEKLSFCCGDDVFVKQKDGRYYLGTVIKSDQSTDRWLVRFGDETERWASSQELRPLASPTSQEEKALCVVCKSRAGENEVLTCSKCGRGYHQHCHTPKPSTNDDTWKCRMCVEQNQKSIGNRETRVLKTRQTYDKTLKVKKTPRMPIAFPYDVDSLQWDNPHRSNSEDKYCYCGSGGDWFSQMLQCTRCRNWFHQNCIACLKYPLYTGDRFYFFTCSVCNYGSEFLRRIKLDWVDLVHLTIFNLTAYNSKKYYDLDSVIIPYIMDNWYALQIPKKMSSTTPGQRREYILAALSTNRNRFKCGKEIKKRANIWGLRTRAPPPVNTYTGPPPSGPLTEQMIMSKWSIIPESDGPSSSANDQRMIVNVDSRWLSIMMGKRFHNAINSDNESTRSTPSPTPMETSTYFFSSKTKSNDDEQPSTSVKKAKQLKFYEMDYQEGGFIKKAVPFPNLSLSKRTKILNYMCRKRQRSEDDDTSKLSDSKEKKFAKTRTLLRNSVIVHNEMDQIEVEDQKPDKKMPLLKNLSVTIRPQDEIKAEVFLPPTPPTSVSDPPTPPAPGSNSSNESRLDFKISEESELLKAKEERLSIVHERLKTPEKNQISPLRSHTRKVAAMNLEISKLSTKNIIEHSKIMSLHHNETYSAYAHRSADHDSSDDTSSRGTLDTIIPPPANFQGKNNPFHQQSSCLTKTVSSITIANKKGNYSITNRSLSIAGNNPIVGPIIRPLKRQLSEKDLIIGPNGEVKRRRLRRPRKKELQKQVSLLKEVVANDKQRTLRSSTGNEEANNGESQTNTSLGENGRCLRQRTEKNYCDAGRRSSSSSVANFRTPPPPTVSTAPSTGVKSLNLSPQKSPFKNNPTMSETTRELKTSVLGYFGATNRIETGEMFTVLGKRVIENGKIQYLIEWDNHCS